MDARVATGLVPPAAEAGATMVVVFYQGLEQGGEVEGTWLSPDGAGVRR
jgi:hypothetical protein